MQTTTTVLFSRTGFPQQETLRQADMRTLMGLLFAVLFCEGAAFGWDYQADGKHALSYMEQTNGLFQVAVVDRETQEYAIYRGVFVEKSGLPHLAPIFRQIPIYALPERRKTETISKEPWMPTQEDMYHYTKPAFPVVERDPGLEVWRQEDGRIVLVFRVLGQFFEMDALDAETLPKGVEVHDGLFVRVHPVVETEERKTIVESWRRACQKEGDNDNDD